MKALIFIETNEGAVAGASLELISAAAAIDAEADAVLIGANLDDAAAAVAKAGAAAVTVVDGPEEVSEDYITDALAQLAAKDDYKVVMTAATGLGKIIAPRVAARLGAGVVNDVTAIELNGDVLKTTRPSFGGNVIEYRNIKTPVAVVSVRGGSYDKPEDVASPVAPAKADITVAADKTKVVDKIAEEGEVVNLEEANVVVAGGRGMGSKEDFALVQELADALGGVVGASRPAVEEGWIPRQHQVGQSGKIVTPDLYIACGISGATQHVSGMAGSKYVVAINKDEDAAIFDVADVGIVGDAKKILPLFIEAAKNREK